MSNFNTNEFKNEKKLLNKNKGLRKSNNEKIY